MKASSLPMKIWREKNPEKYKLQIKKGNENSIYVRLRKTIFSRDNYRCQICGSVSNLQIHHIQAKPREGREIKFLERNNNPDNLITLCEKCHRKIDRWKVNLGLKLRLNGKWSRKFKRCLGCGTTEKKHWAKGLCLRCYELTRQKYKSEFFRKHYGVLTRNLA